jgi:hypothetical protein
VLHELVEPDQGRLRCQRELLLALAEQTEKSSHLAECLLSRRLDRVERTASLRGLGIEQPSSTASLHDDHADRVCDDVMELASDALPLFGHGGSGSLLLLSLEGVSALLERDLPLATVMDHPSDDPRDADEHSEEDGSPDIERLRVVHRHGDPERGGHRTCEPHAP